MEKTRNFIIQTFEQNISAKMTQKLHTSISQQLYNKIGLQYNIPILQIIRGVVHKNLIKVINQLIDKNETTQCIQNCYTNITKYCKEIWKQRCNNFISWEKTQGITMRTKKKHKYTSKKKENDPIKELYIQITNSFMHNIIHYTQDLFDIFTVEFSVGRALAD